MCEHGNGGWQGKARAVYPGDGVGAEVALARHELEEVLCERVVLAVRAEEAEAVVDGALRVKALGLATDSEL